MAENIRRGRNLITLTLFNKPQMGDISLQATQPLSALVGMMHGF